MHQRVEIEKIKVEDILSRLRKEEVFMFLNSNKEMQTGHDRYSSFDWAMAAGVKAEITDGDNAFDSMKQFCSRNEDWAFGVLSYDLKNTIEQLTSSNFDGIKAPLFHFFIPEQLYICRDGVIAD